MEKDDLSEKMVDYLYGDLSPSARSEMEAYLRSHPEMASELQALRRLQNICRERLKDVPVPAGLEKRLFLELGIRRPWYSALTSSWVFRPVLAGAMVLLLTLGVTYKMRDWQAQGPELAQNTLVSPPLERRFRNSLGENLRYSDLLAPSPNLRPQFQAAPSWRPQPTLAGGLVTFASYGENTYLQPDTVMRSVDIPGLEQEAQHSIAQFSHQQALRLRVMGDFQGAAKALAIVIKTYPDYPGKFEALAQRIDCLFRTGQGEIAKRELIWLGGFAPDMAYLVAERWAQ